MNIRSLALGTIFILGQCITQWSLFSLVFVNTDWGVNGLGAGTAILTLMISGIMSFFCGGILISSQFYRSTLARTAFSLVAPIFFFLMLVVEKMYGRIINHQGVGTPHLMPIMYITMVLAFWMLLQITCKKS